LVPLEAQSLRSHPLYFFVECVNFPFELSVLRLRCIAAAHFFEGFLDGELVDFSHLPTSLEDETTQRVVSLVASHSALVLTGFARLHLDEAASLGEGADRNSLMSALSCSESSPASEMRAKNSADYYCLYGHL